MFSITILRTMNAHLDVSDLSSAFCALPLSHSCVLLSVMAEKCHNNVLVSDFGFTDSVTITDGITIECHI